LTQKGNFFILPTRKINLLEEQRPSFRHVGRIGGYSEFQKEQLSDEPG